LVPNSVAVSSRIYCVELVFFLSEVYS